MGRGDAVPALGGLVAVPGDIASGLGIAARSRFPIDAAGPEAHLRASTPY